MLDQPLSKEFNNDPVFYGPDGNVLTEEESAFLWNETACPPDSYYDDDEYVITKMKSFFDYKTLCSQSHVQRLLHKRTQMIKIQLNDLDDEPIKTKLTVFSTWSNSYITITLPYRHNCLFRFDRQRRITLFLF